MDQVVSVNQQQGHVQRRLVKRELKQWAVPREGLTVQELAAKFEEQGVSVVEIDEANNRILITHITQEYE